MMPRENLTRSPAETLLYTLTPIKRKAALIVMEFLTQRPSGATLEEVDSELAKKLTPEELREFVDAEPNA